MTGSAEHHLAERVEAALKRHVTHRCRPPRLGAAIHDALFNGGARVRPRFALGVALACGDDRPPLADAVAVAVECLHCASLAHDDLPCFDDADTRRGRPAVHAAHGQALAVLTGDALIVLAFQTLADVAPLAGERLAPLLALIAESAGPPHGLVAGQAMESETAAEVGAYHAAKTGALFEAAAACGAAAAGGDVAQWRHIGASLGAAYQIADDLHDALGKGGQGKPTGQDAAHGRPSAVAQAGVAGALADLRRQLDDTAEAIPSGPAADTLRQLVREQAGRFLPADLAARASA